MTTDLGRNLPSHDGDPVAIKTHTRDIRAYAWSTASAVVALSVSVALIASVPCLWPPPTAATVWPQCAGTVVMGLLHMDPVPVKGTASLLGTLFMAMLLAVVFMRPSASSSSAQREAIRGHLVAWSRTLALLTAVSTVWWVAMAGVQLVDGWSRWGSPSNLDGASHPVELLAGLVLVFFFASIAASLQPGLGLTTRNIQWAQESLQRIDDWESRRLPRLKAKADLGAAASLLFFSVVIVATHSRWDLGVLSTSGARFLTAACAIAFLWLALAGACNGFHGVDVRVERGVAIVVGVYSTLMIALALAYLLPLWAALLWSAAWVWATTATVSAIALSRYRSPSRWRLSLQANNDRKRRRLQRMIDENVQILQRAID